MQQRVRPHNLANTVYDQLKSELFEFRLLPGDRFTEAEAAERTGTSRTPVRQALYRLQREGFLDVNFHNGWEVLHLDFLQLDALYELRILLEQTSARCITSLTAEELDAAIVPMEKVWLVPPEDRSSDGMEVAA